jgi:polyhydroxyalkanoate synthesis regulator phasin
MEDLFKKVINAGVGFVSLTTDRVQTTIDKLVQDSKLSEQEGRKIMDDLNKNADSKRKEFEKQISGVAAKVLKGVGVAPNADLEDLKRSVKGSKSTSSASTASSSKKAAPAKPAASSATSKAAGTVKKAADKTSAAAGKTQKSAAAKAGAAKSEAGSESSAS